MQRGRASTVSRIDAGALADQELDPTRYYASIAPEEAWRRTKRIWEKYKRTKRILTSYVR